MKADIFGPVCVKCQSHDRELRPYGKLYQLICFSCAMKPDQIKETTDNFAKQLEDADDGSGNIVLTKVGPMPVTKPRQ